MFLFLPVLFITIIPVLKDPFCRCRLTSRRAPPNGFTAGREAEGGEVPLKNCELPGKWRIRIAQPIYLCIKY